MHTVERRLIARRNHNYAALQALGTKIALQKVVDFATALAHQPSDNHIRVGVTAHHAQQPTLTDTRSREYSEPLTAATRQHRVDRMDPSCEGCFNAWPLRRRRRQSVQPRSRRQCRLRPTINAMAMGVDHAGAAFLGALGELDHQYGVLGGEAHRGEQPDLEEDVVVQPAQGDREDRAEAEAAT